MAFCIENDNPQLGQLFMCRVSKSCEKKMWRVAMAKMTKYIGVAMTVAGNNVA